MCMMVVLFCIVVMVRLSVSILVCVKLCRNIVVKVIIVFCGMYSSLMVRVMCNSIGLCSGFVLLGVIVCVVLFIVVGVLCIYSYVSVVVNVYVVVSMLYMVVNLVCVVRFGSIRVLMLLFSGMVVWWMFMVNLCLFL